MPMVEKRSQAKIIDDYMLLQELREKWWNSVVLTGMDPADARMYRVFKHPGYSCDGLAMWTGRYVALLSAKDADDPFYFIEMAMRDMDDGDIVILFSEADYKAAQRCEYHIEEKNLFLRLEQ